MGELKAQMPALPTGLAVTRPKQIAVGVDIGPHQIHQILAAVVVAAVPASIAAGSGVAD